MVDGGAALAKRLNVPSIVIGLTIVAFGTSAPEMVVNLFASSSNQPAMALGNVLGSNIFNVLVVLGVSSLFVPLVVKTQTTWNEIPLSLLAAAVVAVCANDIFFDGKATSEISRTDGLVLLGFFGIFMAYNIHLSLGENSDEEVEIKEMPLWRSVAFLLGGLALLVLGGKLIVDGAVGTARMFGLSERVIALTIVAMGTSLPELATSAMAAYKKNVDIAIGNVVGSNIFNIFLILGLSSSIRPVSVAPEANLDVLMNVGVGIALFLFIFTGRGRQIDRWEGILMLIGYAAYLTVLLVQPV